MLRMTVRFISRWYKRKVAYPFVNNGYWKFKENIERGRKNSTWPWPILTSHWHPIDTSLRRSISLPFRIFSQNLFPPKMRIFLTKIKSYVWNVWKWRNALGGMSGLGEKNIWQWICSCSCVYKLKHIKGIKSHDLI
jgi:hypothetical protein